MKSTVSLSCLLMLASTAYASGSIVNYTVDGEPYQGYYISPAADAPLVLLIHDWDGLTDYEVKRAGMLAEMGYAVFAADLFGKGVRPTELKDKRRLTGELYQDRAKMRTLLYGALAAAKAQGGNIDNAVTMGYCFGGAAVRRMPLPYSAVTATARMLMKNRGGGSVTISAKLYIETGGGHPLSLLTPQYHG